MALPRLALLLLLGLGADTVRAAEPPFALGVEYTESGLAAAYASSGVRWAKTRLEAFSWGAVEKAAPSGGRHLYNWSCTDALVAEYQRAGIRDLQSYLQPKSAWGSVSASDVMPKPEYLDDYGAFVRALVERYDDDGADDMPGLLAPIRLWVVGGEWTGFWPSGNADDYLALLAITRREARAADPEARLGTIPFLLFDIFQGNVPSAQQVAERLQAPTPFWRQSIAGMLKILDRADLYDFVDLHSLSDYTELPPMLAWMRGQLASRGVERPIYLDDAWPLGYLATTPGDPRYGWPAVYPVTTAQYPALFQLLRDIASLAEPAYSRAWRWLLAESAAGTVRKVVTAAGEGAAGIQIGNTEDWLHDSAPAVRDFQATVLGADAAMGMLEVTHPAGYDFCQVRAAGPPRPAFQDLRLLTALVDGYTDVERLAGPGAGLWAYRFTRGASWTVVAWREDGVLQMPGETEPAVDVDVPVDSRSVAVIAAVTAPGALPEVRVLAASGGKVRLPLTSVPVFLVPAGTANERLEVPIVLSAAGLNGSFFTTELVLANRGARDAVLALTYTAALGGGGGTTFDVLPAGKQRVVRDAITYLRAAGVALPASGDRGGTLAVRAANLASEGDVTVLARTTTAAGGGRAGLAYDALAPSQLATDAATVWGLRQDGRDRSNLAVLNAGDAPVTLRATVRSPSSSTALSEVTLAPGAFHQWSGILAEAGVSSGSVRIERVAGSAPWTAYGVLNDQATSDGSFVPAWPDGRPATALTVPALVESGAFTSELVAGNGAAVAKELMLRYVTAAGSATTSMVLAPGEQKLVPEFVQSLRDLGVPGIGPKGRVYAGALLATSTDGDLSGVFLGARTSTPAGFGVFYPAAAEGVPDSGAAWLFGLRQDAESRTNLALVNMGESGRFRVDLFDGETGELAAATEVPELGASGWAQLDRVLLRAPGVAQGYARVTRSSGTGPFLAYAVVNDGAAPGDRTGDGAFLPMVIAR